MDFFKLNRLAWMVLFLMVGCGERDHSGDEDAGSAGDPDHATRSSRLARDAKAGGRQGFDSAMREALDLALPDERNAALADLARRSIDRYPAWVERVLREMPLDSEELPGVMDDYISSLMARDLQDAVVWADSIDDPALHEFALQRLLMLMPDERLADAAGLMLDAQNLAAHGFDAASEQFLQRWTAHDQAAAGAWLSRMPAGDARDAGVHSVASHLIMTSHDSSSAWLESLPANSLRNSAIDSMAVILAGYPEPLREGLMGPPDSMLRELLHHPLQAHLAAPPENDADDEAPAE
jgi:hypothetical protein